MEFDSRIKKALIKINFVERYEKLAKMFDEVRTPSSEMLEYFDGKEVIETINELGYESKFMSKEKFFKTKDEKIGNFTFRVHIVLKYGIADFVWVVNEGKNLIFGYPFSMYPSMLASTEYSISKPVFGTYEDIDEILKITFDMYEDFKMALIELSSEKV